MKSGVVKKMTVVFEQGIIANYRVPFFEQLSKRVNLTVVASRNKAHDGVVDVQNNLPFEVVRLEENDHGFHPQIFQILSSRKADVYISFDAPLYYVFSHRETEIKLRSLGVRTLWMGCDGYWIDNLYLEKFLRFAPWNPQKVLRTIRDLAVVKEVDGIVAHSNYMADYFRIVNGLPKEKIFLAHNAVDTALLEQKTKSGNFQKKPRSIAFVGRLTPGKKIDSLLRSYKSIENYFPDSSLTIVGDGSLRLFFENYTKQIGLKRCVFAGAVYNEEELSKIICPLGIGVLPGLGGLGINTLMACGLPVIAGRADGTGLDLVEDGKNGYLFDGTEKDLIGKLIKALKDPQKLVQMGRQFFTKNSKRFFSGSDGQWLSESNRKQTMIKNPKKTTTGKIFLNLGCGSVFSSEWNNIDLYRSKDVIFHDLKKGIPFGNNVFDAVYSSHVLEHFSREKGEFLVQEIFRTLKPGGIVRLVLPDLEGIVKEYSKNIENFRKEPSEQNLKRYQWSLLELYDQTVRQVSGGEMLKTLKSGDVDWEYVSSRAGDEFYDWYPWNKGKNNVSRIKLSLWQRIFNSAKSLFRSKDPAKIGELHQWMYDEVSLTVLLERTGFKNISRTDWNISKIPEWQKYNFDESKDMGRPRKPDSFYLEAQKP